ncbi:MAG: hypothetical protein ACLTKG_00290 [Collinsella intestinalis]
MTPRWRCATQPIRAWCSRRLHAPGPPRIRPDAEALAERIARLEAQIASGVPSAPMSAEQLASATRSKAAPAPVLRAAARRGPPAGARHLHVAAQTSAPASVGAAVRRRCRSRPCVGCLCCPRAGPGTGFHPVRASAPRSVRARPKARCPRNGAGECTGDEPVTPASADDAELQRRWSRR